MKRVWEFLKMLILSPEALIVLAFGAALKVSPQTFTKIGSMLSGNKEPIRFLAVVPFVMLGLIIKDKKDLLFPEHAAENLLQQWPEYYLILDRYWASIIICAACGITEIIIWALNLPLTKPSVLASFIAAIVVSPVTYLLFHSATIKIRRILSTSNMKH
jgi:hypothetical protein